jgi:hypothetical protein
MIAIADPAGGAVEADPGLLRLARTGSAAVPLASVPGLLGLTPDEAAETVAGWVDAGAVQLWPDLPGGPALVLSALAGARLGLELIDTQDGGLRWAREGTPPAKPRVRRTGPRVANEVDAANPDKVPNFLDTLPDKNAVTPHREFDRAPGGLPRHLLGLGHPWPVAPVECRCGVCGKRERLKPGELCLWCNRIGAEPPVTRAVKAAAVKAAGPKGPPGGPKGAKRAPKVLKGGVGKPRKRRGGTGGNSFDLKALRGTVR